MLRGTAAGLELVFSGAFDESWSEIAARLSERPDFYRGSRAVAIFEGFVPEDDGVRRLVAAAEAHGIVLHGFHGDPDVESIAVRHRVDFLGAVPRAAVASFERKRAARAERREITEKARSLDADFAGARADIAGRRARGEPSVPRPALLAAPADVPSTSLAVAAPVTGTLYHRGTLRGGQTLQQLGTIVVVGDVNPGAELVATGDIVVFGALRGTAHAGAQGDATARVFALELAATQLRIATFIAANDGTRERGRRAEVAFVSGDRIALAPYAEIGSAS